MNGDGTVKSHQKISSTLGNFTGVLDDLDFFGSSISNLGDLDGDNSKLRSIGFEPKIKFKELVKLMVEHDLRNV